jgi:hypothetical protein
MATVCIYTVTLAASLWMAQTQTDCDVDAVGAQVATIHSGRKGDAVLKNTHFSEYQLQTFIEKEYIPMVHCWRALPPWRRLAMRGAVAAVVANSDNTFPGNTERMAN